MADFYTIEKHIISGSTDSTRDVPVGIKLLFYMECGVSTTISLRLQKAAGDY